MLDFNDAIDLSDVEFKDYKNYIGNGYRFCSYTTDTNRNGRIILGGYDTEGNPKVFLIPHRSHIKYNVKYKTQEQDIFGRYVETRYFPNEKARRVFVDNADSLNIIECFKPEYEFLHQMFDDVALDATFNKQALRVHFFDIETEIAEDGLFVGGKKATERINLLTIYDTKTSKFYTWSLEHADINFHDVIDKKTGKIIWENPLKHYSKDDFVFFEFHNNERQLLEHFLDWFESNYPDVLCGFNSQSYDIPYLTNRIERVLGKPENVGVKNDRGFYQLSQVTKRLSPVGVVRIRDNDTKNERGNKQAEILVDIGGIFSADELVLYRDKFKIKNPLDGGHGLSNIGEAEGCGTKIPHEDDLKKLYETDYQTFYEYNVRDVELLKKIEDKCKLIPLARSITSSGLTNYGEIYSSISYLIGSLSMFSKVNMKKTFTSFLQRENESIEYEGAFVFPPIPGLYTGGIATVDFNSLYPSSIQAMNLSPETYVGKVSRYPILDPKSKSFTCEEPIDLYGMDIIDPELHKDDKNIKQFYLYPANGSQPKIITRNQLDDLIATKCIFTRNNTLFLKHSVKKGVVSEWCRHFYALRKSTKKEMQRIELSIHKGEIADNELEIQKEKAQNLDSRQMAIKIMINSIYGICGTKHSPIYNVYCAQSITRLGKFCNQSASKYIGKMFKEKYNIPNDYIVSISGDTDSQFVNINCITQDFMKKYNLSKRLIDWSDDDKLKLWKFVDDFVEKDLNKFVQNFVKEWCHTENPEVLRYSLEYVGDNGIYESKKHYGVRKILSEGPEVVNKIKYSGIELKKANIPVQVKKFLADIYTGVLTKDWKEYDFKKYLGQAFEEFCKLDINELAFWKGYNTERSATGFLQMEKGATGISKACTFYNQLIEKYELGGRYDTILVGDKVRFTYIKPQNKHGINVIAFKGKFPEEFRDVFKVDYETMWDKLIVSPLKNFIIACQFRMFDPTNMNILDPDDL